VSAARLIINELRRELGDRPLDAALFTGSGLAELLLALESGEITGTAAKDVFAEMVERDEAALAAMVDHVLAANPDQVDGYRAGKTGLLGFFVGQVVRSSQGKANPQVVQQLLVARLG
jgi:glutaminyl-tRNA synthetase